MDHENSPNKPFVPGEVPLNRDCYHCGAPKSLTDDLEHKYTNEELGLTLTLPAIVCTHCGATGYSPASYKTILEAEEAAQGRPYVRIEIRNGRVLKHSLH